MLFPLFSAFLSLSISIVGTIDKRDGIGRQSIELGMGLKKEFNVQVVPFGTYEDLTREEESLIETDMRNLHPLVLLNTSLPEVPYMVEVLKRYKRADQRYVVYTMHESDFVDPHFVKYLNFFDAVLVPDPFLVEVFQKSGVSSPIEVIPLAVDLGIFLAQPLKKKIHKPFVFGNFSSMIARKDQMVLLKAFSDAFKNNPDVQLILAPRGGERRCIRELEDEILKNQLQNVKFKVESKTKGNYLRAFQAVDCYVSPSWGEGFSIQPREAMALGIPVIVSANSGQKTIAESGLVFSLRKSSPIKAEYSCMLNSFSMGKMYQSDREELSTLLRAIYDNKEQILKDNSHLREWASRYDIQKGLFLEQFKEFFIRNYGDH
jgi:glycosyltransferase involved in cell wall biosynthesis